MSAAKNRWRISINIDQFIMWKWEKSMEEKKVESNFFLPCQFVIDIVCDEYVKVKSDIVYK